LSAQGLRPAIIEKDYYVTEVLRIISAFFPCDRLLAEIGGVYEEQCEVLCSGAHPSWDAAQTQFSKLRGLF